MGCNHYALHKLGLAAQRADLAYRSGLYTASGIIQSRL